MARVSSRPAPSVYRKCASLSARTGRSGCEPREIRARPLINPPAAQRERDATTGTTLTITMITTGSFAAATVGLVSHHTVIICPSTGPKCGTWQVSLHPTALAEVSLSLSLFRYGGNFSPHICTEGNRVNSTELGTHNTPRRGESNSLSFSLPFLVLVPLFLLFTT